MVSAQQVHINLVHRKGQWFRHQRHIVHYHNQLSYEFHLHLSKSTDKVEPKFKIGDVVRFKGNETLKGEDETHKIVDYDNEDKLGETIEVNQDVISDEFLNYLNQL